MAVADLAAQGPNACESLSAIGARQAISVTFLEQLFAKLRRAGVVESVRGAQGGYRLSGPASSISLDSIIHAVDASPKAHGCSPDTKLACTGRSDQCLTHDLWGALESHIEGFLASITVQDVVDGRLPLSQAVMDSGELEAAE